MRTCRKCQIQFEGSKSESENICHRCFQHEFDRILSGLAQANTIDLLFDNNPSRRDSR